MASWQKYMPDWDYRLWNEDNFDVDCYPYAREAYEAGKFAFVSDVARLYALNVEGGIYLDTDVEVFKTLEPLLGWHAFAGFEACKKRLVGTCVMGSEAGGRWVAEQLTSYGERHFLLSDGSYDLTTNVLYMTTRMKENGFVQNGEEQDYKDLHVFPADWFSPYHTTGEFLRTANTYCHHHHLGSWTDGSADGDVRNKLGKLLGQRTLTALIKMKRRFG